ncbi:MAG: PrsW family glutamic-type intramembrane protease [Leptospira sp.]|nr:PrsW family glutamic-type intramembrane protease [Leptospira sp.]
MKDPAELLDYLIGSLSVLPWMVVVWKSYSPKKTYREIFGIVLGLICGWLSTVIILQLHPILWPETDFVSKKKVSLLTQTAHIAFIKAGMVEEGFKIFFILLLSFLFGFDYKNQRFLTPVVIIAGYVALGFSLIENTEYIRREVDGKKLDIFLARTIHSSNIHLLINICFALFLLKSNLRNDLRSKLELIGFAFLLAVIQHGVVDFLLIPGATIGLWIATALFVGIWVWVTRDWKTLVYLEDKNTLIPASEYSSQSN